MLKQLLNQSRHSSTVAEVYLPAVSVDLYQTTGVAVDNISNICCSSSTYTDRCSSSTLVHIQTDAVTVGLICKDRWCSSSPYTVKIDVVAVVHTYSTDRCCSCSPYTLERDVV